MFKDLNFAIKANTTVAFIGKSGSGKSTILNLMAKLNDAEEGQILFDYLNKNNKKFNTLFKAENLENKLKKLKKDE